MKIKVKNILKFIGPAFIVSVAYIDPGNFATNISGGSLYNYNLLGIILISNLMAIFLQINTAKLGIATNKSLAELSRNHFSKNINVIFWIVALVITIATTLAEFLGGVLGLTLLFNFPLLVSALIMVIVTLSIIYLAKYGQRVVEKVIIILVLLISTCYAMELFLAQPDFRLAGLHTILPVINDRESLLIAVGIIGATVMPHVIFLHSNLVQHRCFHHQCHHLKMAKIDVVIAMNISFLVNASILIVSAAVFYKAGLRVDSIELAHQSLKPLLGNLSSGAFGLALLISGLSSTVVSVMAGEDMLDGFINIKLHNWIKRSLSMLPAIIVILLGINPMRALVLSQVALSFTLPFAIIPLIYLTNQKKIMHQFVNTKLVKWLGMLIATIIIILNIALLLLTWLN